MGKLYNWDWVLVLGPNKSGTQQKWDPAQRQMTKLGPSLIKVGLSLIIVGPCQKTGTLSEKWDPVGKVGPCRKSGTLPEKWDPARKVGPCRKSGTLSEKWDPVGKVGPCRKSGTL